MTPTDSCTGKWMLVRDGDVVARGTGTISIDTEACEGIVLRELNTDDTLNDRIESVRQSAEDRFSTV